MKRTMLLAVTLSVALSASISLAQIEGNEREITAVEDRLVGAINGKNLDAIMSCYLSGDRLLVFDVTPPLQYVGSDAYRKDWQDFFDAFEGPVKYQQISRQVFSEGNLGYVTYAEHFSGREKGGKQMEFTDRTTDVVRKIKGRWLIVHEHSSLPVDLATGKAELNGKP